MTKQPTYDLIVIGDDLSSHVAAAYASHCGLSTLLIAQTGLGGLHLIGDFVFHLDPTPMNGLGPNQCGRKILEEMGIELPAGEEDPMNPAYQVLLPGHRLDFCNTPDDLLSELCREFPDLEAEFRAFYEAASDAAAVFEAWLDKHPRLQPATTREYLDYLKIFPHIFRYKFNAVRFDKVLTAHPLVEKVWEAQQALCSFNLHDLFSFASAKFNCTPFEGITSFSQGKQYLFNELIKKLEVSGGLYLSSCRISSLNPGKPAGVELFTADGTTSHLSAQNLIVSTKADAMSYLFESKTYSSLADRLRPARILFYPFTLFFGIERNCLPEKLARHAAVVPDVNKDLSDHNLIILDTPQAASNGQFSDGKTAMSATVFLPDNEAAWQVDALKNEADQILEKLDAFFPFLRDAVLLSSLDQSIDLSKACRSILSPKYFIRNAALTSFAAKTHQTRFDHIFLSGASLMTDAGFAAEFITGKNAVRSVLRKRS